MMWDFGGGANATRSGSPTPSNIYLDVPSFPIPRGSSAPPTPFMPIGAPSPHGAQFSSTYDSQSSSYNSPSMSRGPAAGAPVHGTTHQHQSSRHHHSSHHVHVHRHSVSHLINQPQRPPVVQKPHHVQKPPVRPPLAPPHSLQPSHFPTLGLGNHPQFQYSKCTGKRKALCIGINYTGQTHPLFGCVNDAKNVRRFLISHHRYRAEDIVLLVDDAQNVRELPTRHNILDAMHWLVRGACPHDALFFHYSGHGGQIKDRNGDEVDGLDEVIFPVDYKRTGCIVDDLMHTIMVKPLPAGCRLTAVFDSCHSGSVLDLPYLYHSDGREKGSQVTPSHIQEKYTPADVISWSGCKDSQTSADTFHDGSAVGAMSYAFITALRQKPDMSYQDLLRAVRSILKSKYSQKPQLSSSHRIDTHLKFIM